MLYQFRDDTNPCSSFSFQAKQIIQVLIAGGRVVGQAFARALKQEYEASQRAAQRAGGGSQGRKSAVNDTFTGMSLQV